MKRWEYKESEGPCGWEDQWINGEKSSELVEFWKNLGLEGWELVAIRTPSMGRGLSTGYFKRELPYGPP